MPSAEAFKDNICLNKPLSHVGAVELEHKHDAEKKKKKKKTSFTQPVKERIQRDLAGVFFKCSYADQRGEYKKKKVVDLVKHLVWILSQSSLFVGTFCLFIALHYMSVIFNKTHRQRICS